MTAMQQTRYLIGGSSHAAIEAVAAIRAADPDGEVVLVTADSRLPYSPTILPYVVKGWTTPERTALRDEAWLAANKVTFLRQSPIASVDVAERRVRLKDGQVVGYEKLLLATGARPALPPIPGLETVPFHVLRTVDDALALKDAIAKAKRAVVLGAGLVGLHAAETMVKTGLAVTVVEMQPHVLPGYFDDQAATMIETAFTAHGVDLRLGCRAASVVRQGDGFTLTLASGEECSGDLLLIAAGVRPVVDFLAGSGVEIDQGVLVDPHMRTSVPGIWAAGDVTQPTHFFDGRRAMAGILPNAVEQGRIAGADMCGDAGVKPFPGAVSLNTFGYFGNHAISVGALEAADARVECRGDEDKYLRLVVKDGRLCGISAINHEVDAGVMWQLILRRIDLSKVEDEFLIRPLEVARTVMSRTWR